MIKKFLWASQGFVSALNESSFRIQLLLGAGALFLLVFWRPPVLWCVVVFQMIGSVLAFELVNTALETLCDLVDPNRNPKIKRVKDCAAAAVLLNAIISLVVLCLFVLNRN